jgi:hypothetical protein
MFPSVFAAIVRSRGTVMPLAATLTALVEGVTAGLVGHAVVIAPDEAAESECLRLAEAMGADLVVATGSAEGDWRAAAEAARGEWLMLLEAGEMLEPGWPAALERHAITGAGRPGVVPRGGLNGLAERMLLGLTAARTASGLVAPRGPFVARLPLGRPVVLPLRRRRIV